MTREKKIAIIKGNKKKITTEKQKLTLAQIQMENNKRKRSSNIYEINRYILIAAKRGEKI